jgi:hypothetical protein
MAMTMTRADRAGRTHGSSPTGHHGRTVHKDEVPRSRGDDERMFECAGAKTDTGAK